MNTFITLAILTSSLLTANNQPFALHPENPHYFLFRAEPTVLITSAEHYHSFACTIHAFSKRPVPQKRKRINNTFKINAIYIDSLASLSTCCHKNRLKALFYKLINIINS